MKHISLFSYTIVEPGKYITYDFVRNCLAYDVYYKLHDLEFEADAIRSIVRCIDNKNNTYD